MTSAMDSVLIVNSWKKCENWNLWGYFQHFEVGKMRKNGKKETETEL